MILRSTSAHIAEHGSWSHEVYSYTPYTAAEVKKRGMFGLGKQNVTFNGDEWVYDPAKREYRRRKRYFGGSS